MRSLSLCVCLTLLGCTAPLPDVPTMPSPGDPLSVGASFEPLRYFAERITQGLTVTVTGLTPQRIDPASWQPNDAAIHAIQMLDLLILNGADFEPWASQISLPLAHTVNTTYALRDQLRPYPRTATHHHGPQGKHAPEGLNGHTWLDPIHAMTQAEAIHHVLHRLLPQHRPKLARNLEALKADLAALHMQLKTTAESHRTVPLVASHPSYSYLAARYDLQLTELDLDPHAQPSPDALAGACRVAHTKGTAILLWEETPDPSVARTFAERCRLASVVFMPGERPTARTYLEVMQANLDRLETAMATAAVSQ